MGALFERIILTNPHADLSRFEDLARRAKDGGVTHVTVSSLAEKSRWEIDDQTDPYLHWSIIHASLFKVMPPEVLQHWVPRKWAADFFALVRKRLEVLGRLGLKGAFLSYEPMWWPESAFEKAPQLRGPRVDHPLRSKHPRFSPDISHPKVLDIYRHTVEKFLTAAPGIDLMIFSTNDSGTGISWSEHLYNHANGPTYAPWKPFGLRLKEFVETCEEGAKRAGKSDAEFYVRTLMNPMEQDSARQYLKRADGTTRIAFFWLNPLPEDSLQGLTSTYLYPLADLGQPFAILRKLASASKRGKHGVIFNPMAEAFVTEWQGDGPDLEVLREFLDTTPDDVLGQTELMARVMKAKYGAQWGPRMLKMYWHLDRAMSALEPINSGGMLFEIWVLNERWLQRPLVVLPELLTEEEKSYYRKHQFQAAEEWRADNPLESEGVQLVSGMHAGIGLMPQILGFVESEANEAIAALGDGSLPEGVEKLRVRLKALVLIVRCCRNFFAFTVRAENVRKRAVRDAEGRIVPPVSDNWGNHGDREDRTALYALMRAELDNTQALIDLLESTTEEVLVMARREEEEDIFLLSPKLVEQLRRKMRIMMDHWLDVDLLLKRPLL